MHRLLKLCLLALAMAGLSVQPASAAPDTIARGLAVGAKVADHLKLENGQ